MNKDNGQRLPKDWDALDLDQPFTVVGMLSWAISEDLNEGLNCVCLNETIRLLEEKPEDYRW